MTKTSGKTPGRRAPRKPGGVKPKRRLTGRAGNSMNSSRLVHVPDMKKDTRKRKTGERVFPDKVRRAGDKREDTQQVSTHTGNVRRSGKLLTGLKPAGSMRLNRYISLSGICSRRRADELIRQGSIRVNDQMVTELGTRIQPNDKVKYEGKLIQPEKKVYILLNKPKDYITTLRDPGERKTVMELIDPGKHPRVYPVGRLDRHTTGVLLLTNDGELTRKLAHPSGKAAKVYHVFLNRNFRESDMQQLLKGIALDDGPVSADKLSYPDPLDKKQVGIEIHSGRNRIVRRIFEYLDYQVVKLDRVYFAGLTKKGLGRGKWRYLNLQEIARLKMGRFK